MKDRGKPINTPEVDREKRQAEEPAIQEKKVIQDVPGLDFDTMICTLRVYIAEKIRLCYTRACRQMSTNNDASVTVLQHSEVASLGL
jgi:hypothetical protein